MATQPTNETQTTLPAAQEKPAELTKAPEQKAEIVAITDKFDPSKYNPIMFSQAVLDMLPPGVNLVPYVVAIPEHERYTKDGAGSSKKADFLAAGDVMIAHTATARIGKAAGIQLERVTDRVHNDTGKTMLLIEYKARLLLPDGTLIEEIGGKEEEYKGSHCREKIDSKARRNAYRKVLDLPLTLPKDRVDKPFVIFKAVYDPSAGGVAATIHAAIEEKKGRGIKALYGSTTSEAEVVDVTAEETQEAPEVAQANEDGEVSFDGLKSAVSGASSLEALEGVWKTVEETPLTAKQHKELKELVIIRKKELEGEEPKL